ncbi:hypothetical protein [Macrococcus sp. PK]|uniref:coiled-coil domain-containing protein n=1 Tax=Macrococcus sp. PK TaxID=2801919 RepID=UPI001F0DAFF9|nr:hypothetical protein [Macrococcus sp. PK]MCH4983744.1 hypothetical protein [Macrococcus sp. PK]
MVRDTRQKKFNARNIYSISILILVGAYILLYALSFFKSDPQNNMLMKENETYTIGDYKVYLMDQKYNPETETFIAKFFIKEKESSLFFLPLTEKNFSTTVHLKDDLNKKYNSKLLMPNKNFLVMAIDNYKKDDGILKTDLELKTDVVTIDKDKSNSLSTSFYFSNNEADQDNNIKFYDKEIYYEEGAKYQRTFIDKDIKSVNKTIEKYQAEIENAKSQIKLIDAKMSEFNEDERNEAKMKQEEFKKFISDNNKKIEEQNKKIIELEAEKKKTFSQS